MYTISLRITQILRSNVISEQAPNPRQIKGLNPSKRTD